MPTGETINKRLTVYGLSAIAGIALLMGLTALQLHRDFSQSIRSHEERATDVAATLAGFVATEFKAIDNALIAIAALAQRDPAAFRTPGAADAGLWRYAAAANPAVDFGITDARGDVVAMSSGLPTDRRISLADRPQFVHHKAHDDDGVKIFGPYLSRPSGLKIFTFSRRLAGPDGEFLGMVAATIKSEKLFEIFANLERGETSRLVIARHDGIVLACSPFCAIGADISDRPVIRRIRAGETRGVGSGVAPVDGKVVFSAFQTIAGFPVVALNVINRSELVGRWWRDVWPHVALELLIIAIAAALAWQQLRTLRRRLLAEQALRISSDNILRTGIESLRSGFVAFDSAGRLRIWNRRFAALFPYLADHLREDVSIRVLAAQAIAHRRPDLPAAVRDRVARRLLRIADDDADARRWVEPDGRVIEASDRSTADDMTIMLFRDVTEQERQAQELRDSLYLQREHNAQQQRFVAIVSHEFRTPLSVIDSSAQLLASSLPGGVPPRAQQRITRIRDGVRQLVQLIDRILTSTRLSEGRIERSDELFDVVKLVRALCEQHLIINKDFAIDIACSQAEIEIKADPRLIEHAISNIVSNAVKYSGRSKAIDIAIDAAADSVAIAVRDHGLGIPADEVDRLFQRFYRASSAKGIRGTGLGLHLARDLISMHGGTIAVESELGVGTKVVISLPRAQRTATQRRPAA